MSIPVRVFDALKGFCTVAEDNREPSYICHLAKILRTALTRLQKQPKNFTEAATIASLLYTLNDVVGEKITPPAAAERVRKRLESLHVASANATPFAPTPPPQPTPAKAGQRKHRQRRPRKATAKQMVVVAAMADCEGNYSAAARNLGKSRATVKQQYEAAYRNLGQSLPARKKTRTQALPKELRGGVTWPTAPSPNLAATERTKADTMSGAGDASAGSAGSAGSYRGS